MSEQTTIRFGKAVNQALSDAMAEDDTVIVLGEDVAGPGGSFGVTRGLRDAYGAGRVLDTPISEATIVSMTLGAAMSGLRPVVEIMFMDFVTLAMDALVNQAAKAHFMFGGQVAAPMVLRAPHGGSLSAGPQHSQCLEAWFAHIPGLKVVCPSNATDAYALMRAAIRDPNPVIFVENKALYARADAHDGTWPEAEIGKASIVREGNDVSIVAYGAMVAEAQIAADKLAGEGVLAEIVDLRSIQPWDEEAVLASLAKTHRLVIVHEAVEAFGVGAEIAARMADIGFDELDAPIVRVAAPFMPVPFAKNLETRYRPSAESITAAVARVME